MALMDAFKWRQGVCLREYCTLHIGGEAEYFFEPRSVEELQECLAAARKDGLPVCLVGHGSNVFFADEGVRAAVVVLGSRFRWLEFLESGRVRVSAGFYVPTLARLLAQKGLIGFEHAVGIPATLGGLLYMNGGSMRCSVSSNVESVTILDDVGALRTISAEECGFGYRKSRFQKDKSIIVEAMLRFDQGRGSDVRQKMLETLRSRRTKFPLRCYNCGSVFKNDPELYGRFGPPGKIVESLGFKGYKVGDVEVSSQHANFIVNSGKATARDLLAVIDGIRSAARDRLGCELEPEVLYIDKDGHVQHP